MLLILCKGEPVTGRSKDKSGADSFLLSESTIEGVVLTDKEKCCEMVDLFAVLGQELTGVTMSAFFS